MFHAVEGDERSSATEAGFAMDGDGALLLLHFLHEALSDVIWRRSSVDKLEIQMLETLVDKLFAVISGLVQTDDKGDAQLLENGDVLVGSERTISIRDVERSGERDELAGHDPV